MYNYTLVYPTHTPKVFQSTSTFFDLWATSATLEVKLGQGSFGSVWRAKHRQSGDTAPWPRGKRYWSLAGLRHWIYRLEIWKYSIEKVATNVNRSEERKEHDCEAMFQFTNQRIVSVLVFLPHIPQPAWDTGSWFLHTVSLFLKLTGDITFKQTVLWDQPRLMACESTNLSGNS